MATAGNGDGRDLAPERDDEDVTGPHQIPRGFVLVRSEDYTHEPGRPRPRRITSEQADTLTEDRARRVPLTLGGLLLIVGLAAASVTGALAAGAHLRSERAADLRTHDTSATSHADVRALLERAVQRVERRQDATTSALERIREDLRRALQPPARKGRR